MRTVERHLQQCLNKIENWALYNGFKFSKSKTQCVHFCQLIEDLTPVVISYEIFETSLRRVS